VTTGLRRRLFAALVVICIGVAAATVVASMRSDDPGAEASTRSAEALPQAEADDRPMIVMRTAHADDPVEGGAVVVAPLDGAGERTVSPLKCDRVYYAGDRGLCLAPGSGFAASYRARIFGSDFKVLHELDVAGIPSRARVSQDGRYGTVTLFVTGHTYAEPGSFSTQTTLIDMQSGERIAELEDFTVTNDGEQVTAVDVNFWGVTFGRDDSDHFYATMATGGKSYLIEGSVSGRTAHVLHKNVECPSLSPDGTRIAYKRLAGSNKRPWRLTVLDLETMRETPLAESRSIDDQVEWLDDDTVLYGIDAEIYAVPADGSGRPRAFARGADSPAVVRWPSA
jgi:hypothetical protein